MLVLLESWNFFEVLGYSCDMQLSSTTFFSLEFLAGRCRWLMISEIAWIKSWRVTKDFDTSRDGQWSSSKKSKNFIAFFQSDSVFAFFSGFNVLILPISKEKSQLFYHEATTETNQLLHQRKETRILLEAYRRTLLKLKCWPDSSNHSFRGTLEWLFSFSLEWYCLRSHLLFQVNRRWHQVILAVNNRLQFWMMSTEPLWRHVEELQRTA